MSAYAYPNVKVWTSPNITFMGAKILTWPSKCTIQYIYLHYIINIVLERFSQMNVEKITLDNSKYSVT